MTDEEINLAIAEACGWEIPEGCVNYRINTSGKTIFFDPMTDVDPVPDYCNDLNAMHEAEEAVILKSEDLCQQYDAGLYHEVYPVWSASALQRAEAFLRTIGKWRGE